MHVKVPSEACVVRYVRLGLRERAFWTPWAPCLSRPTAILLSISIVSPGHSAGSYAALRTWGRVGGVRQSAAAALGSVTCTQPLRLLTGTLETKNKYFAFLLTPNLCRGKGKTWVNDQRLLSSRWSKADLTVWISLRSFLLLPLHFSLWESDESYVPVSPTLT